jgi:hypothetical protein
MRQRSWMFGKSQRGVGAGEALPLTFRRGTSRMVQQSSDLIEWEADQIVDHASLRRGSLTASYEILAREVETRACMHLRGPLYAQAVAAALRRRAWSLVLDRGRGF